VPATPLVSLQVLKEDRDTWVDVQVSQNLLKNL
jgi:hypothetical protein